MADILYELVKETRDDVKALSEKLNAHIIQTNQQIEEARRPTSWLHMTGNIIVKLGAAGGMFSVFKTLFDHHPK
jgi:hypothetical protein